MNYHDIVAQIAIRISALVGAQAAALETTYNTRPLTSANFKSAVFPFGACKDAVLLAEEKLAGWIAATANHPWRIWLNAQTATLANRALLPNVVGSDPIIGVYGSIYDSSDSRVLTEQPLEVIERITANAGSFFRRQYYHYKVEGNRVYHTRTLARLDACVYNRTTQKSRIDANNAILLPDTLEEAYIAGALSYLTRDGEFGEQALGFRKYFDDSGMMIQSGIAAVPPVSTPAGNMKPVEG